MDTNSESNSVKSTGTPTSAKTPNVRKQVGFSHNRPKLIIPPPQGYKISPNTGRISEFSAFTPSTGAYKRKQSVFDFAAVNGIKDFTKAGLGVGEKSAFWLYNKFKSWSRKSFTHVFLTVVLVLYTIGGAFIFESIEGNFQLMFMIM